MIKDELSKSPPQAARRHGVGGIYCFLGLAVIVSCSASGAGDTTDVGGSSGTGGNAITGDSAPGSGGSSRHAWINRTAGTAAAGLPWIDVASDATGMHLVAVTGLGGVNPDGNIWTSEDAGATWTNRTKGTQASGLNWRSVASDSTGTQLVAVTAFTGISPGGEDVWTSADAGATWTKRITVSSTSPGVLGPAAVSDSTGSHLVLADGDIWASTDAGATWTDETVATSFAAQAWVDIASDSTGTRLVAITAYGDIWTSSDAGATWANQTKGSATSGQDWQGVASDSTGTHLVAVCMTSVTSGGVQYGGDIWISTDSGTTWTNRTAGTAASGRQWIAAASDATGAHIVAASSFGIASSIWTSADSLSLAHDDGHFRRAQRRG